MGRRLGPDGQHPRPRAGVHGLEQVEARLARRPRLRLPGRRRHGRVHALGRRRALRRRRRPRRAWWCAPRRRPRSSRSCARRSAPTRRDDHARRAPHVRLGRAAVQDRRHRAQLLRVDQGARRRCPARPPAGCTGDVDIATLGKGQGDGPSKFVDTRDRHGVRGARRSTTAVSARLKVTRAATRITADALRRRAADRRAGRAQMTAPAGATYAWAFGDGRRARRVREHAYAAPGRYPVTLTVRDGDTVLGTATETVTVFAPATGMRSRPRRRRPPRGAHDGRAIARRPGHHVRGPPPRRRQHAYPLVGQGPAASATRSPVAATDIVSPAWPRPACVTSGRTLAADAPTCAPSRLARRTSTGARPANGSELWDGETLAGWSAAGAGVVVAQLHDRARQRRPGPRRQRRRALVYGARQFKDFELSVDYRVAADELQRRRAAALPAAGDVADADRNGYQVAILDNGAAGERTGAITQERPAPSRSRRRARRRPSPRASGTR